MRNITDETEKEMSKRTRENIKAVMERTRLQGTVWRFSVLSGHVLQRHGNRTLALQA